MGSLWIKNLFGKAGKATEINSEILALIKQDNVEKLAERFDFACLKEAALTQETFSQVHERGESSVLIQENKYMLCLAIEAHSTKVIQLIARCSKDVSRVCVRDTYTVQGLVSKRQLKNIGFKSHHRVEMGLPEYFDTWKSSYKRVMISGNVKDAKRRLQFEATLQALQEHFSVELNAYSQL